MSEMKDMEASTESINDAVPATVSEGTERADPVTERTAKAPFRESILDPEVQLRKFARGKLELNTPIQDGKNIVKELHWDFLALTGNEYVDAMDRDSGNSNTFRISNAQALNLFSAAAGKATPGIDATDVRRGLDIMDAMKAVQMATVFFSASNRVGNRRISDE